MHDAILVGGAINDGVLDLRTFPGWLNRPTSTHATGKRAIFRGSASTPPVGGVQGMSEYQAAKAMLAQQTHGNARP